MPRIQPPHRPTTSAHKPKGSRSSHESGRTYRGRVAKLVAPAKINRQIIDARTELSTILKYSKLIDRDGLHLYQDKSNIVNAGDGAFAMRDYLPEELIGPFKGNPVYALELQTGTNILFSIKEGRVQLLDTLKHILWADNASKEFTTGEGIHSLIYGVQVDNALRLMNCSILPNVKAKSFVDPKAVKKTIVKNDLEHHILKPNARFEKCITMAAIAKNLIDPATELFLDYSPETEHFDFETMDQYPIPNLSDQDKNSLLEIARKLDPASPYLNSGNDWLFNETQDAPILINEALSEAASAEEELFEIGEASDSELSETSSENGMSITDNDTTDEDAE